VVAKKIDHLHRWGEKLVLVKGLPAEVCEDCKEVYLPPASLRMLDEIVERREPATDFIRVPVYSLP
jgi:YgiT-type zinc finger domain-containing protein